MLRAVLLCLQEVSEEFVSDIKKNGVIPVAFPVGEAGSVEEMAEHFSLVTKKLGVIPNECVVIASDRQSLFAARVSGMKCVGFIKPFMGESGQHAKVSGTDDNTMLQDADTLFGYCKYVIEGWEDIGYSYINRVFLRLEGVPFTITETEHLILRELTVQDVPRLCEICQAASVREFSDDISDDLQEEAEKHEAYIEQAYRFFDYGYWGVYDRKTQTLIGRCGIRDSLIDGIAEVELGYLLAEEFRGKGYAKEAINAVLEYAFMDLYLTRIVAVIDKRNTPSLRLAVRCGMLREKEICKNGRACDVFVITSERYGQSVSQISDR